MIIFNETDNVLHNSNGIDYKFLNRCTFIGADKEYYKDSWQKYRYALLQSNNNSFVVASMCGAEGVQGSSWGQGMYFKELKDAQRAYENAVVEYLCE